MRFGIHSAFTVGFNDKIKHNTGFKISFLLSSYFIWNAGMLHYVSHHKFFKRKKRKKESQSFKWKVSKKQVFLIKYYPIHLRECGREVGIECCCEPLWVEILSKTGGSNLLFCKPGTYLCSLFFYFLFWFHLPIVIV